MIRRTARILVVAAAMFAVSAAVVDACPNCAEAMPGSRNPTATDPTSAPSGGGGGGGLADGFYYAILFMLAVPFTLAGVGGYALYRATRSTATATSSAA